jgi:hypothetical protein
MFARRKRFERGQETRVKEVDIEIPSDQVNTVYGAISSRRTAFDTLMWQVPALGLAAQAFLLTIAFGSSSSDTARCVAGGLSVVVALVAIQTMLKHRANEKTDALILEKIELALGIRLGKGSSPHQSPKDRGQAVGNDLIEGHLAQRRSVTLWVTSLLCFAAAGVAAIVITLSNSAVLN